MNSCRNFVKNNSEKIVLKLIRYIYFVFTGMFIMRLSFSPSIIVIAIQLFALNPSMIYSIFQSFYIVGHIVTPVYTLRLSTRVSANKNRRNGSSLIKVDAPVYTYIYLSVERHMLNELLATSWPHREQLAASVVHSTVNVGNVHAIQTFISLSLSLSLSLSSRSLYCYTHIQGEAKYIMKNHEIYHGKSSAIYGVLYIPALSMYKRVTKCRKLLTRYYSHSEFG